MLKLQLDYGLTGCAEKVIHLNNDGIHSKTEWIGWLEVQEDVVIREDTFNELVYSLDSEAWYYLNRDRYL